MKLLLHQFIAMDTETKGLIEYGQLLVVRLHPNPFVIHFLTPFILRDWA